MQSFISNRTFSVNVNDHHSNPRPILAGLAQESPLSPTLYVADIPKPNGIRIAQFADDTVFYNLGLSLTDCSNKVQLHLNLIDSWASK